MKDKMRRKAQRKINKAVRELNTNILNDNLWRGRFTIRQKDAGWFRFDDNSGGELRVLLEARDKKTNVCRYFMVDNYDVRWRLWTEVNDFIVSDSHVWDNIQEVKDDKTDWTKVK